MTNAPAMACRPQRGVALLVVLWACTLLAILLGSYAALARTEGLQARYQFSQARAHYAAEAGVMRAIYALQDPSPATRWMPDGRDYTFTYEDARVTLRVVDESGKVDINSASPDVLGGLFRAAGVPDGQASELANRVVEWRSFGVLPGSQTGAYGMAGRDYKPRHGPFASVEELQMVLGMEPAIYQKIASQVTLWSGRNAPEPTFAPPLALMAVPGMTPAQAQTLLAARAQQGVNATLGGGRGVTHSIYSEATLPDGTRSILRATVRLQGARSGAQPYAVLRWREGEGE
ncbi:general secretion pathway protein GspK [Dyella terrae]|uniref:General secretion pathway protein GspK n=3 Tax=Rhodanobacteraceae TaxID=1775411 RepID=A0A4R0YIP1_9GAMM|nr:general secretion pathway protein GspK [Dyella terrae]TCI08269.1 general secretion pathway protein GspK [Dyella soli]